MTIRVIVADDHPILRAGMVSVLNASSDLRVVAEAGNGAEVMRAIAATAFDVLLLDVSMPGKTGLDILRQIRKDNSRMPILIVSSFPEDQYAIRAIKAGASGYITKMSAPGELVSAVRMVANGRKFITPAIAEMLADAVERPDAATPHENLSDREFQTMKMIAAGHSLTEIAEKLCISVKTVSVYRSRVLEKMRMKSNVELTRYVVEHNLNDNIA
jgi:two-component system, NarL family, invasion response regulator UvrY